MRYSGKFGFAESTEIAPGVWEDVITERDYRGDVEQTTETLVVGASMVPQVKTTTSVSVLSDGVLRERYSDLRYVTYQGLLWTISSIVHEYPRITVYIGERYNGPTPKDVDYVFET